MAKHTIPHAAAPAQRFYGPLTRYEVGLSERDVAMLRGLGDALPEGSDRHRILERARGRADELVAAKVQAARERDASDQRAAQSELRGRLGQAHDDTAKAIHELVDLLPQNVQSEFLEARLPSGKKLMNDPDVLEWLLSLRKAHRVANPATLAHPARLRGKVEPDRDEG